MFDTKSKQICSLFESIDCAHILYVFQNNEAYIENAASFILAGIKSGKPTLIIENDRLWPVIEARLSSFLDHEKRKLFIFVNNYDYYSTVINIKDPSKNFYSNEAYKAYIQSYTKRVWAHVEWSKNSGFPPYLENFLLLANQSIKKGGHTCVSAYDKLNLTNEAEKMLIKNHDLQLTDQKSIFNITRGNYS
ncbi:hypothetical protein BTO30_16665, partial [Domibacillus antri]